MMQQPMTMGPRPAQPRLDPNMMGSLAQLLGMGGGGMGAMMGSRKRMGKRPAGRASAMGGQQGGMDQLLRLLSMMGGQRG